MSVVCHACGAVAEVRDAPSRRDTCAGCGADLRCCRNCRFFDATAYNQCRETQAERQLDKQRGNFCGYFAAAAREAAAPVEQGAARAALDALFAARGK